MWGQLLVKWLMKFIVTRSHVILQQTLEIDVMLIKHPSFSSACVVADHFSKKTVQLYILSLKAIEPALNVNQVHVCGLFIQCT